jgi:hypothetical protein
MTEAHTNPARRPRHKPAPAVQSLSLAQKFAPHECDSQKGTLAKAGSAGARSAGSASALGGALRNEVTRLARLIVDWNLDAHAASERIGDFRYLILEFTPADGVLRFVQVLSEPETDLTMEVGPGQRSGPAEQAVADGWSAALQSRGFLIGGNAHNFRKRLGKPRAGSEVAVAAELCSLLTDVCGFDGTVDLGYEVAQGSHLKQDHVLHNVSRGGLKHMLRLWGFNPTLSGSSEEVLDGHSHGFDFHLLLRVPYKGAPGAYWEVHLLAYLYVDALCTQALLDDVNRGPYLTKASANGPPDGSLQQVIFQFGINLAGGVSPNHLRAQVLEWLECVRMLWAKWRTPPPEATGASQETQGQLVH